MTVHTKEMLSVEVQRVVLLKKPDGREVWTRAFLDIAFGDCLVIKGFRVVEGKKGRFVSYPQQKAADGEFYTTSYSLPGSKALDDIVTRAGLEAYDNALKQQG